MKSPLVADTWDDTRRMHAFPREDQAWALGLRGKHVWHGIFINAIESLGLDIDPDTLRYPNTILLPSIHLFTREPSKRFSGNKKKTVRHESIARNTVLTFYLMVRATDGEKRLRHPTENELRNIIQFIGAYEGISPFGGSSGFGQFKVESIHLMGRDANDSRQLPADSPFDFGLHDEGDEDRKLPAEDSPDESPAV